jgi:hypothetical protein
MNRSLNALDDLDIFEPLHQAYIVLVRMCLLIVSGR